KAQVARQGRERLSSEARWSTTVLVMQEPPTSRMVREVIPTRPRPGGFSLRPISAAVRIRVDDPIPLAELLSFLRGAGAIAFRCDAGTLDVQLPGSMNERAEQLKIGALLMR